MIPNCTFPFIKDIEGAGHSLSIESTDVDRNSQKEDFPAMRGEHKTMGGSGGMPFQENVGYQVF